MNKVLLKFVIVIFLISSFTCESMAVSNEINVEEFLSEAKGCFLLLEGSEKPLKPIPNYLQDYLKRLEPEDYVSHKYLSSGELLIRFRKEVRENPFSVNLGVDVNAPKTCERITFHEVLG